MAVAWETTGWFRKVLSEATIRGATGSERLPRRPFAHIEQDNGPRCGEVVIARHLHGLLPRNDVRWAIQGRINPPTPVPTFKCWQFEGKRLPVGIQDPMENEFAVMQFAT